jgi:hypothetical protein
MQTVHYLASFIAYRIAIYAYKTFTVGPELENQLVMGNVFIVTGSNSGIGFIFI